ncbi:MAG: alpha/beta hydrolase [Chloroflexota bacterium]
MSERRVMIAGEVALAGVLHLPEGQAPRAGVVVCHPHTLLGGDKEQPVVVAIAREATERGLAALRIDFRGAGESEGEYGGGTAEVADVAAAIAYLRREARPDLPLGLAGYSFGAIVVANYALVALGQPGAPRAVAFVGLPTRAADLRVPDLSPLRGQDVAVLAVVGQEDYMGFPETVEEALAPLGSRGRVKILRGADHAYWGFSDDVARLMVDFFLSTLTGTVTPGFPRSKRSPV